MPDPETGYGDLPHPPRLRLEAILCRLEDVGLVFVALVAAAGAGLLGWAHARIRRAAPVPEAVARRSIRELTPGRYRLTGRVVPIQTTPSGIDRSPCVYVEHAEYRTVGSELVPLLREVERRVAAHPFHLDDGTGRLMVDPGRAFVDTVTLYEDEGLTAERRLRAGEEVELVASFRLRPGESDGGPYRGSTRIWEAVGDECGPPRLGFEEEPSPIVAVDDVTSLLRGLGVVLLVLSAVFAALTHVG